jgi:Polyketide cyclase / dehydrase and lipid transport
MNHVILVALIMLWSTPVMPAPPASQTGSFHLDAPPARVFPLFTAAGERAWAPGWDPEMLSGDVERGSVFRTFAHGHETTWIVTDYQADAHHVSYARLLQGMNIGLVDVRCDADGSGTRVSVRYTLTPLTPAAEPAVRERLEPSHYAAFMQEWQQAIGTALEAERPR